MEKHGESYSEDSLFHQFIGCSVFLVIFLGLLHNVMLSAGDSISGKLPSTHPLTAAGFFILAGTFFFHHAWEHRPLLRGLVSTFFMLISFFRILDALLPEHFSVFSGGGMTAFLESHGLYGRFSVETALFLMFAFGFELSQFNQPVVRLVTVSGCLAVLSLALVEAIFMFFLWGNELSLITMIAMLLVAVDQLYRMRLEVPFHSVLQVNWPAFYRQIAVLALYLFPMALGTFFLQSLHVTPALLAHYQYVLAGSSWLLLCLALLFGTFLDKRSQNGTDDSKYLSVKQGRRKGSP